jgi:hypothetical protein
LYANARNVLDHARTNLDQALSDSRTLRSFGIIEHLLNFGLYRSSDLDVGHGLKQCSDPINRDCGHSQPGHPIDQRPGFPNDHEASMPFLGSDHCCDLFHRVAHHPRKRREPWYVPGVLQALL